jgi:glycosyltransferase involved in cell wall biosynthesis
MKDLTLIIPAKNEAESLPKVLKELNSFSVKKIIIIDKHDKETSRSIQNFYCLVVKQKKNGYGSAIIEGIQRAKTKYVCIFNADGSFDPKYLKKMYLKLNNNNHFVFASRYLKDGGSHDDTLLTFVGNKIFTLLGKILFKLNLSDILFTYIIGNRNYFNKLKLKSNDFRLCVEIPVKIQRKKFKYTSIPSIERLRLGGKKKVNEFLDGFLILYSFFRYYLIKND